MSDQYAPDLNDASTSSTAQPADASSSPRKKVLYISLSILWLVLAVSLAQTSWQILHRSHPSLPQFIWATFYAFASLVFVGCCFVGLRKAFKSAKSR